tara:strand:- start:3853 stop:5220 length:1368 start_codon:yes stop_codon:yes gene_type:complete
MTDKPDLTRVWAASAAPTNIEDPDTTVPGKFAAGWTAEVPTFENFNFLQQLFTEALAHISEHGICDWDSVTTYPDKAWVRSTVDQEIYIALSSNINKEPSANAAEWVSFKDGIFLKLTGGAIEGTTTVGLDLVTITQNATIADTDALRIIKGGILGYAINASGGETAGRFEGDYRGILAGSPDRAIEAFTNVGGGDGIAVYADGSIVGVHAEGVTGVNAEGTVRAVMALRNGGSVNLTGVPTSNAIYASSTITGIYSVGDIYGLYGRSLGKAVSGEGDTYDFYAEGTGTNYGPFTGSHDSLISKTNTTPISGDIIKVVSTVAKRGLSQTIHEIELANSSLDKSVFGVYSWRKSLDSDVAEAPAALKDKTQTEYNTIVSAYDLVSVNGVGEGQINVCDEGGDLEIGDYICSSTVAGKGKLYTGSDMRVVVARCMEIVDWSSESESTKQVACVYLCG